MPQTRSKNKNWMVNPRVAAPDTSIRLDNSSAKLENRYLNVRLQSDIDAIDTRKLRQKADRQHNLKTAKKDAQHVFAQAKVLHRWKAMSSDGNIDEAVDSVDAGQVISPNNDSSSDEFDDTEDSSSYVASKRMSNADRVRPTTSVTFRLPAARSVTPGTSTAGRLTSAKRSSRPKTVGPMSANGAEGQSFQHLKDMVENDTRKRLQAPDARTKIMIAMAEKRREDEQRLQLRLQRFYTDLDQFIKKTKYPSDYQARKSSESPSSFMLQFGKFGLNNKT